MEDFSKYCKNRIKYGFFKFIFFLLFACIIFYLSSVLHIFSSPVYALETKTIYGSTTGDWYNQTLSQSGKFIYNANTNGGQTIGNVGTTYSDANFGMYFGFYHTITAGKIYNVKINFNDYDVRHTIDYSYIHINASSCTVQAFQLETTNNSGNSKTISVSFSCPNPSNAVWFSIYKESDGYYYVTTVNWRFNSVQIEEATDGTDNIINNNNMNTHNIINNNNTNTQEIIDNQNQNTEDLIDNLNENFNSCIDKIPTYVKTLNGSLYFNNDKVYFERNDLKILVYEVEEFDTYTFKFINYNRLRVFLSDNLYDQNEIPFNVSGYLSINNNSPTINENYQINVNKKYIYMYLSGDENSSGEIEFNSLGKICKNRIQETTDAIDNLTSSLTNDSPVDISSLGNTTGWLPPGPIDSIINMPLNLMNNLLTALNNTCTPITIPLPYVDTTMEIPCLSTIFSQIDGVTNYWTWVGTICSVLILYNYLLALYKYYDDLTTLKANFISDFGGAP